MNGKRLIKFAVCLVMTFILILLMAFHITGKEWHKWLGLSEALLFIWHHRLNAKWHKNIFRGKYNSARILMLAINVLLFGAMLASVISGLMVWRNVHTAFARTLHHVCIYWLLVMTAMHMGLHMKKPRRLFLLASGYGLYAFIKHDMYSYMFNLVQFSFFDYEAPKIVFFFDYAAIMILFAVIGHYLLKASAPYRKNST
jgi:hypothetical protein